MNAITNNVSCLPEELIPRWVTEALEQFALNPALNPKDFHVQCIEQIGDLYAAFARYASVDHSAIGYYVLILRRNSVTGAVQSKAYFI